MNTNMSNKILTLPAIIVVALVTQIPLLLTIYYSMFRWIVVRPDLPRNFVGLKYYKELLTSSEFWIVFKNTINLTLSSLSICFILGLFLAFLLYRPFPGAGIARTLLIAPFFIMDSVIAVFWKSLMLDPTYGLISYIGNIIGFKTIDLVGQHPLIVVSALVIWQWTPFFLLVNIAGLQSISEEVLEASLMDGANIWGRIYRIILPMITKYITISLILGLIFILKILEE